MRHILYYVTALLILSLHGVMSLASASQLAQEMSSLTYIPRGPYIVTLVYA